MPEVMVSPQRVEMDRYLAAYEAAQLRDGAADLADFLPTPDHPLYAAVLCELVRIDMELGWERDRPCRLADYLRRFPELARDTASWQAVAFEEFRLRRQAGEDPRPEEYCAHFGVDPNGWPRPGTGNDKGPADSSSLATSPEDNLPDAGGNFLDFQLCAELGRGAFARVFLARQTDLGNRYVALKVAADIADETQALVQLQHTNIVPVYSVHRAGRLRALCMPYFGGTTLADVLRQLGGRAALPDSGNALVETLAALKSTARQGERESGVGIHKDTDGPLTADSCPLPPAPCPLPPAATAVLETLGKLTYVEAVLWLAARVADGLAHAHERGIVHRDLKPANILLTDEGRPMLLDFNLSEDTKRGGASAAVVGGTLPYMAPEQLEAFRDAGRPADARGDVYALGVILYELLTGRHPFPLRRGAVSDVLAAMLADRAGPPPGVRGLNPAVSPAVESIVRHCLDPDPDRRYQTAAQLREDVQSHLDSQPLRHAPEPSAVERLRKWARRHPRLTSTTAVAMCAAVMVAALLALLVTHRWRLGRLEALESRRQLGDELKEIQLHLSSPDADPQQREEGLAVCRRAAERYHLPDAPFGRTPLISALAPEEQEPLRRELGELLLAWARGLAWKAAADKNPLARQDTLRFAQRLTDRAEGCYGPDAAPRALWLERARLAELDGQEAEARRLRARAEEVPVRTPRDQLLLLYGTTPVRDVLAFLRESSRHDPQNYATWLVLGNTHAALGQRTEAAGCYDLGIALAPDQPWAYFNRGALYLDGKQYKQAEADFDQVIRLRPNMVEAYFNRSLSRLGLNRPNDAEADLTHILETKPRPPTRVYFARARVRGQLGDAEGQRQDLAEGLRREPTDEHDCISRGVHRYVADPHGALADFEQALTFNPRSRAALQNQASVLAEQLGETEKAVAVLDQLLATHPDAVPALSGRGVLLARLGRREAAHRDARAALARGRPPELVYQVAGIYALTSRQQPEDRPEALRLLSQALRQGYGFQHLEKDRDLDPVRSLPEFGKLVAAARALHETR